ncbi:hypothetical protein PHYSODRAFT_306338 [Phytophthora sojae]|uniref:Uncharacterized protein n=1 Tax=Phytophthora sojae (strain P6497) TaxID=1094619 RepID=G5A957_PHYSP|nr:hypothetical protein PHYSODRAFT_306338 [Phytophthora sojae]EGZ08433.1 hypothetical protein PHYSODRAFT_306338 [Phytophthora sojae]|eukprot:XP_009536605.1 hypothetical protein PHYSODRAFT_306338 [Phytophthora sojae]
MDRLLREFALIDLDGALAAAAPTVHDDDSDDDEDQGTEILVAERVPLETWNRLAQLNNLPRGLRLRQLVWDDGRVSIVELPISIGHEDALASVLGAFWDAVGAHGSHRGQSSLRPKWGPDDVLARLRIRPAAYNPWLPNPWNSSAPGTSDGGRGDYAHPAVGFSPAQGANYIFCLKMSLAMDRWSYELYDVPDHNPPPGQNACQLSFNISERVVPANHVVNFDSRRVLGLPQQAQLPAAIPDQIVVDLVAVAQHARAAAREMGERVAR